MWKPTRLNWQEPTAYLVASATLAAGLYLALKCNQDWLARAGSLIIVYGVLLAASRKYDIVQAKMLKLMRDHRKSHPDFIRSALERKLGRRPTDAEAHHEGADFYDEVERDIDEVIQERRRIFKLHEVILVVGGTLINGFGPWLFAFIRSAA
jgi:hypothetical protein